MKTVKIKPDIIGLTALRNELGFNQELMAMYLKVSLSTIKMAELGHRSLPTYALIRVAEVQIKLAAGTRKDHYTNMHPAELTYPGYFKEKYNQLLAKENKCGYERLLLATQLKSMDVNYQKTRKGLQIIEELMQENKNKTFNADDWNKQQELATNALNKCGLLMQVLLTRRIEMLEAQIEVYKRSRALIREALPEFFTENNNLIL